MANQRANCGAESPQVKKELLPELGSTDSLKDSDGKRQRLKKIFMDIISNSVAVILFFLKRFKILKDFLKETLGICKFKGKIIICIKNITYRSNCLRGKNRSNEGN